GLTLSADGSTLYAARSDGHIIGLDSTDAGVVFDSGSIGGTPDGTAEGTGPLAGNLFVNTNNGRIVEVDLATHAQTVVASHGSREWGGAAISSGWPPPRVGSSPRRPPGSSG